MAIDWTKSMRQTYEVYIVDPSTWLDSKLLDTVTGASITRDISSDTVVSGSIEYVGEINEDYVRIYLIAEQGDEYEKIPLITMLCQTPSMEYNGKYKKTSITGYSPILELEGEYPPLGYTVPRNYPNWYQKSFDDLIVTRLDQLIPQIFEDHCRAPIGSMSVERADQKSLNALYKDYVVGQEDTWKTVAFKLLEMINQKVMITPLGEIKFYESPNYLTLQPTWTYTSDNSSILATDLTVERDLYGVPNVVQIIITTTAGNTIIGEATNEDESSITSIQNRGRRVVHREVNPDILGKVASGVAKDVAEDYAKDILQRLSSLTYTINYTHGYCPVHIGDCVIIDYPDAGINNERAYVISQNIDCKTGCQVEETAMLVKSLWSRKD